MVSYEFILYDQNGNRLKTLSPVEVVLARSEKQVGELQLVLAGWDLYKSIKPEYRLGVFRAVDGDSPKLVGNTYWIINRITRQRKGRRKLLILTANDLTVLLNRRIIPYLAGDSGSTKSEYADDMAKEIIRQNYLSGTARSISTVLSVDSDKSIAPVVSLAFDYRNVLDTLNDIANASYQSGTYLSFDIVPDSPNAFTFVTYTGQRGNDRRYTSTSTPLIIYDDLNLDDLELTDDYSQMATTVYAKGQGDTTATATESTRLYSTIGRIERYVSAGNARDTQIQSEANQGLKKYRPRKIFTGDFIPSDSMQFERDIFFGDYCTVQIETEKIDVRVSAFRLTYKASKEQVALALRSDI